MLAGKAREMGLGSVSEMPIADARDAALDARKLVRGGIDPIEHKRARKAAQRLGRDEHVSRGRGALHPLAQGWLEKPEACGAIALDVGDLCSSGSRRHAGNIGGYGRGDARAGADLDGKAGDRDPRARSHRGGSGLREGAGLAEWREPGAMAWASWEPTARAGQDRACRTSCRAALGGDGRVHGGAAQAARHCGAGTAIRHPDGGAGR
ncbi:MAG: hypothetical protein JOZ58_01040 [Acetobacteraceae bacterium]|nr:hypothetical protein [Acetobacteraceae bacterium]